MVRFILPVAAVLVFAGCGGQRDEAAPSASNQPESSVPVAKAEPAPVKPSKRKSGTVAPAPLPTGQPAAPELPAVVDLSTTPEMLSAHALIVAREQVQAGLSGQADVAQRHGFILATWQPQYQARLSNLAAIRDAREVRVKRELVTAKRVAEHEQRVDAVTAEYEPQIRAERAKTAPILDD